MQGVRVVRSFNQQDQETEKFTASSNELNQLNIKIGYVFSILMPAFTLVVCIGTALIVYLVGKNIGLYPKDISAISSYVGYLSQMLSNLGVWRDDACAVLAWPCFFETNSPSN